MRKFLLLFCIFITACVTNSQQKSAIEVRSEIVTTVKSNQELAREILLDIGIAERYDFYLGNSVDITIPASTKNSEFRAWLQGVLVREAGWKHIEDKYITQI